MKTYNPISRLISSWTCNSVGTCTAESADTVMCSVKGILPVFLINFAYSSLLQKFAFISESLSCIPFSSLIAFYPNFFCISSDLSASVAAIFTSLSIESSSFASSSSESGRLSTILSFNLLTYLFDFFTILVINCSVLFAARQIKISIVD